MKKRKKFIQVYKEFYNWLNTLGYRRADYKESMSPDAYFYSEYRKHIDPFGGVDIYMNDALRDKLLFILDNDEHKIMFVGGLCYFSKVLSLEEGKEYILKVVKTLKDAKMKELNSIIV